MKSLSKLINKNKYSEIVNYMKITLLCTTKYREQMKDKEKTEEIFVNHNKQMVHNLLI